MQMRMQFGPFDAVRQLSQSLQGLEEGDIRFVGLQKELGGFRQIGELFLIQQFETARASKSRRRCWFYFFGQRCANSARSTAVQIQKTRENFLALISLSETADSRRFSKNNTWLG